jgi:hypothetical protein
LDGWGIPICCDLTGRWRCLWAWPGRRGSMSGDDGEGCGIRPEFAPAFLTGKVED